jgi:hypothetical protein
MAIVEIKVPDIGDFKDVDVIEVLVKAGESIKKDDSLVSLETDKATMEVPAEVAGVVKELKIKPGDKVSQGCSKLPRPLRPQPAPRWLPHQRLPPPRLQRLPQVKSVPKFWCWAVAPVGIPRLSARRIWAKKWCWLSAMPIWVACA